MDWKEAVQLGVVLALGGEFAFVVLSEAVKVNLIDPTVLQIRLVAIVGLSMALTPLLADRGLARAAAGISGCVRRSAISMRFRIRTSAGDPGRLRSFRADRRAHAGGAQDSVRRAGDRHGHQVDFVRRFGNAVYYGDPSRPDLLRSAGAGARGASSSTPSTTPRRIMRVTRVVRRLYPGHEASSPARTIAVTRGS